MSCDLGGDRQRRAWDRRGLPVHNRREASIWKPALTASTQLPDIAIERSNFGIFPADSGSIGVALPDPAWSRARWVRTSLDGNRFDLVPLRLLPRPCDPDPATAPTHRFRASARDAIRRPDYPYRPACSRSILSPATMPRLDHRSR